MALLSKNKNLTTSYQTLHTGTAGNQTAIHSLSFTNNTASQVTFDLTFYSAVDNATYQLATTQVIGAYKTYTWPKPINMAAGDYVQAKASTGSSAVVTNTSYYESSTTINGFTLRGTWSSSLAYSVNDIVLYNGISYAAIQASTNQTPSTATTYWQKFTEAGQTGATGASGITGASGATGTQGASGVGATGIGATGIQGASGATGTQGASGIGATGSQGIQGASGATGSQGIQGASGSQGIQGAFGATGTPGASGIGATGIGATGPSGQLAAWSIVTAATGILNKEQFIVNTSSGGFSISLPASPSLGHTVVLQDGANWYTNNLTVLRNGSTIEGQSENLILDVTNVLVYLIYDGTTWQVVSTVGPMGASGITGASGATGTQGASGIGATGAGVQGASGIQGASGATGATGVGAQGASGSTGLTGATGLAGATGSIASGEVSGTITFTGTTTFTGITTLQESIEVLNTKTTATGTVAHDFTTGSIFHHSSISANFTANITNVPTTNDRTIVVSIILVQGATPYIPNALQIDGSAQTIKWQDNTVPTGSANKVDIVSFSLIRTGSAWTVLGGLSTYG
jgi:collagen type VII alpha